MKTQVTITMDTEIREDLKKLAKKAGTNFSNLLNMAAAHMVQTQKINFDYVAYTDEYSLEDYKRINRFVNFWIIRMWAFTHPCFKPFFTLCE